MPNKILICDDSVTNLFVITKLIETEISREVSVLTDPREVMNSLASEEYDLLLLDYEMPYLNGIDVMELVRKKYSQHELPILFITGAHDVETRNRALSRGANDFVHKPIDQVEIILRINNLLAITHSFKLQKNLNHELELRVEKRTQEINSFTDNLIDRLAIAGEMKDNDTAKHTFRVGEYSRILASGIGLPDDLVNMIKKTAPLHDVGKISISDHILLKPGKLTEAEFEIMKTHALAGETLLAGDSSFLLKIASTIAGSHHEKWDGSGYPRGLAGESIPIEGRIVAIADVFDALVTKRPYKEPWPVKDALDYIAEQSGKYFDPELVAVFLSRADEFIHVMINANDECEIDQSNDSYNDSDILFIKHG
ncbi:HD domain-containing phosphohydrolase [Psychromonas sp. Urea-02u-13]|uniref:HD domain-containing phosphohydrolase n=1 Tax=Psychromonas sp. Urea-02u-13 TaxID=2058326 RepID=UPI000C34544D|nr:HD domain-containing phosphohydrolase [Psychromonas sp. Urea-02u-13]PKG37817.1 two-component system response regulator [Psychromonas sp. Urea-02u-13]